MSLIRLNKVLSPPRGVGEYIAESDGFLRIVAKQVQASYIGI
jgi:hypothetical protein